MSKNAIWIIVAVVAVVVIGWLFINGYSGTGHILPAGGGG
jgi:hypothetical protein